MKYRSIARSGRERRMPRHSRSVDLEDKRALVTGATSGIGRAMAIVFLASPRSSYIDGAVLPADGADTAV
jgi:NAD(P)-dependent dehydrogenase (short-subunit alcohol dehydrogenase family)